VSSDAAPSSAVLALSVVHSFAAGGLATDPGVGTVGAGVVGAGASQLVLGSLQAHRACSGMAGSG
jgi:hypothetical protein